MKTSPPAGSTSPASLYRCGAYAVAAMIAIMALQIAIFIIWPPPETVEGFLALFEQSWLLGLLSMDLLYIINNTLLILIYLAIYAALKPAHPTAALIGLVLGLVGICAYYASNTAFEMLSISNQYAAAGSEAQKTALLGAGSALLAIYKGTAFNTYYVLNGICLLIFAIAILKSNIFSRSIGFWGLASGILMSIPSTAGMLGLVFSLLSLIPWAVFAILVARRMLKMAHAG